MAILINNSMRKLTLILAAIATTIFAFTISSCMKHDMDHGGNTMLKINYPAAYVVNGGSNNLSVIKLSDNTVTETISLNGATFPHHIYINPAKTKLAVAITSKDLSAGHGDHGGSTVGLKVQIIDALTGMIDKEILLPRLPHNAIFNNSDSELWIGQMDTIQSQVLVYKTSDWSLQNTIDVGKGLSEITFSNNGSMAFACNTIDGTVTLIDANTKMIQTTLTVGADPVGAWSASNGKMYVDNEMSQTISEISVSDISVTSTINLGFKPGYVAFHTSTGELWVSDASNGQVVYYTMVGGVWTIQGHIVTGADAHAITFNNEGTKAFVTNQGSGSVSLIDVPTHTVSQTITVGSKPNGIIIKE
jgi:YVTN family beta-propeller protein